MHIKFVCAQLLQDMDKKEIEVKKAEVDYLRSHLDAKTAVSSEKLLHGMLAARTTHVCCQLHE